MNEKLNIWKEDLKEYNLPKWEELPEINLYMDQVIILMNKYLSIYSKNPEEDKIITPSIINNYVKLKVIPSPIKKKYSKTHLAYLIMVCILKQCLSISTIKNIIPLTEDEEKLKSIYEIFRESEKNTVLKAVSKIDRLTENVNNSEAVHKEVLSSALEANAFKLYTEKIVDIEFPDQN